MKPLIGITTATQNNAHGWPFYQAYRANVLALVEAGGLPVLVPNGLDMDATREIYERLDGILLPGGGDVDPASYNESQHELTRKVDPVRDALEMQFAQWAVEDDVPILGICRGHQVLNVALGGKLIQDVPTMVDTDITHSINFSDQPRGMILHEVEVSAGSQLAQILGATTVQVNSIHHQAVAEIGDNLTITAKSADGIIEGLERTDKTYVLSVQWHPEDLVADHEHAKRLFASLVEAAKAKMQKSS